MAHEALGSSLLSRAATWNDPERRKADRIHARAELLRAKELGDTSDLCKTLLAALPEDGSEDAFSQNQEVQAAMQRGESLKTPLRDTYRPSRSIPNSIMPPSISATATFA